MWQKLKALGGADAPPSLDEPLRLLVADDDPHDQLLLSMAAEDWSGSVHIDFANDGIEALEKLRELFATGEMPDVLVLDLRMPRLDGHGVLERIRSDSMLSLVDIVVFSSSKLAGDIERSKAAGALRYEMKPGTYSELVEFIDRLSTLNNTDESLAKR